MDTKRTYRSPSIEEYGSAEEITQNAQQASADAKGDNNTAYSPGNID